MPITNDGAVGESQKMIIEIKDVSKVYRLGDQNVRALKHVNLKVGEGRFMAIA